VSDRLMVMRIGRKVRDCPIAGGIDDFRERVVAYMIGARDDFTDVATA
jgi:ABC-type sugar transport system ATPase subunit